MNLFSKIKSLFPLTLMQSICLNVFMGFVMTFTALGVLHKSSLHPLWILAFYFCIYGVVRVCIDDFVSTENTALVYHSVFGFLRIGVGIFIIAIAGMNGDSFNWLWLSVFGAFLYFGFLNLIRAAITREEMADKKAQEERLNYRGSEFQYARAQYHRDVLERARLTAEAQHRENALLADLAEFLADTGQ